MALETFNYLNSLVAANPVVSDGLVNGDDHIRGIKLTLLNTFPNITGAVTASQADLNTVAGGASKLLSAGTYFSANATDGFQNTLAGDIDVVLQTNLAFTFQRTLGVNTFKANGGIQATGEIKGPGITPIGSAVMWFDDTLPTDGLWVWANGQIVSNANTVAPVLLARWGSRFGGNGTTTMGVPNMQEVVPVGKSGMGGATSPGLLASISSTIRTAISGFFGSDTVTVAQANLPAVNLPSTDLTAVTTVNPADVLHSSLTSSFPVSNTGGGTNVLRPTDVAALQPTATTSIGGTVPLGGLGTALTNLQPSKIVNWIIRIG